MAQIGWAKVKIEPTKEIPIPFCLATFHKAEGAFVAHLPNGNKHPVNPGTQTAFLSVLKSLGYEVLCDGAGDGPPTC